MRIVGRLLSVLWAGVFLSTVAAAKVDSRALLTATMNV